MSQMQKVLLGIIVALAMSGRGYGQGLVTQRNLSLSMAKTIAETAISECKAKGYNTAAAVVDRSGYLLVLLRDEQSPPHQAEMSRRKAYTARMFRSTSMEFQKHTNDPAFAAQRSLPDILALGGGVPIMVGNEIIGAAASSGSTQETDEACARAGIAKVADLLK